MASNNKLIVLVEPDEAVREAIASLVRQHGFRIETFESAGDLGGMLKQKHPVTLICETALPDMRAFEVLEAGKREGVPVIFLGHLREIQQAVDLVQMGARDFLEKPFPQERLLKTLDHLAA